jgi:hypothetical protein
MSRTQQAIAAVLCVFGLTPAAMQAATNYFLVAEWPGRVVWNDSYVIPLTNAQLVAHARNLIAQGPEVAGSPIVVAYIAAGADGINRDLRGGNGRIWSWHVTEVVSFADATVEILDGWPTGVENYPQYWINPASGQGEIGFWNYTVVEELRPTPRFDSISREGDQLKLSLSNLTPPCVVVLEQTTDLSNPNWAPMGFNWVTTTEVNLFVSFQGDKAFYRAKIY